MVDDVIARKPIARNAVRSARGVCCPHCEHVHEPGRLATNWAGDECAACGEEFVWGEVLVFRQVQYISIADYVRNEDGSASRVG
jgi:hypothetical protein